MSTPTPTPAPTPTASLARALGTRDAVVVGLSAMLGAGVFVVWGPAVGAAGSGLLVSLGIAGVLAFCNATSSAQLAAAHPASGGTYLFGRVVLGPWWGFVAGWGFVVGKTASCAAMALAFAAYALPGQGLGQRLLAGLAVAAVTALNLRGITRTARVATVLVGLTLATLAAVVVLAGSGTPTAPLPLPLPDATAAGVLQGAAMLFFAFAGYARIATLAEEVRRPEVLGRAVLGALAGVGIVYLAVALAVLHTLGSGAAASPAPLAATVEAAGAAWATPFVRLGAAAASLGALLALVAGVGRTALAMAREGDLPGWFAHVDDRYRVPAHAQLAVGAATLALVLVADLRGAIGFSAFGVLVYYFVANAAALRQPAEQRRWPRPLQVLGAAGCLALVASLPVDAVLTGLGVLAVGLAGRALVLRRRGSSAQDLGS